MANPPAPLMSPSALIELGRSAVGRVLESAASLATVPVRVLRVLVRRRGADRIAEESA